MDEMTHFPKLRFPEFSGDWEEKKFIDISEKIKDGTHFSPNTFDESDFLYITAKNVKNGHIDLTNISYVTKEEHKEIYKRCDVKFGDLLLTKDGTIGQACVNSLSEEFSLLSSVAFIRLNSFNSNNFLYQLIVSPIGQKEINKSIAGQALKRITLTKIKNFKSFFPFLLEQKKISNFLTSLDTKIEILSKKQELLSEYKKGLMQQIFSQAIRFKADDGSNFPDWNSGKLGNYGNLINGLTYSPDNIVNKGLLVLRSSNIQNGRISLNDKVYVSLEVSSEALTREDDILICVRNGSKRLIGKSTIINKNIPKSTHGAFMTVFRGESNKFISHWFQSSIYYKEVHKNLGATINSINGSDLKKFKTIFPTKPEQTKIASFLNSIDSKIKKVNKQLDESKQFKKALLQQMFV